MRITKGKYNNQVDLHVRILTSQDNQLNEIIKVTGKTKGNIIQEAIHLWVSDNKDLLSAGVK